MQPAVMVGLISMMTGSALQEDIAATTRALLSKGRDILWTPFKRESVGLKREGLSGEQSEDSYRARHGKQAPVRKAEFLDHIAAIEQANGYE
jgi:hypothetical protein